MKRFIFIICLALFVSFVHAQEMNKWNQLDMPLKMSKKEMNSLLDPAFQKNTSPEYKLDFDNLPDSALPSDIPDSVLNKSEEYQRLYRLFGSYDDFRRKFMDLKVENKVPELNLTVSKYLTVQALNPYYSDRVVFIVDGPISFFYKKFNKHGQAEQKYLALKKYAPKQEKINKKYNTQNVQRWTGLQGDQLTKFVLYCHFSDEYLLRASEYEIIEAIFSRLKDFKALADTSTRKVQLIDSCNQD